MKRRAVLATAGAVTAMLPATLWAVRGADDDVAMPRVPELKGPFVTQPPARICGDAAVLAGPPLQPAGSVRVEPGQNLNDATIAHPAGTTFWLAPGTHTLGTGEFGQVIPKENNAYVGAPGAILDGQNVNRYAFTQRAPGVVIKHLTIQNFRPPRNEGVVNQSAATGWTIANNTVRNNGGAGVFVGSDNVVRYNCLASNGQYGLSMYKPPVPEGSAITNITIDHNEISRNNTDDTEAKVPGCGCSGGSKFWDVGGAVVSNNWVHHNKGAGLWADTNNVGFLIEGNYINDNDGEGIWYETSYNFMIRNNTLLRNAHRKGRAFAARGDNSFPVAAIYIAESGGDSRVNNGVYATSEITGNLFRDNWNGVVLWEANERFYNSPAETSSTAYAPKGGTASLSVCNDPAAGGLIDVEPGYSDCRRKTQNVWVHDNQFRIDKAALGIADFPATGRNAIFSSYGTAYPSWSPYQGARDLNDVVTKEGSTTITSKSANFDVTLDKYAQVNGKGLSYGSFITSVTSRTTAVISDPARDSSTIKATIDRAWVIENAIFFGQNNRFSDNHYVGDWTFANRDRSYVVDFDAWRAPPLNQDAGSTMTTTQPTTVSLSFSRSSNRYSPPPHAHRAPPAPR